LVKTNASKPDQNPKIGYNFLISKHIRAERKFNFYLIYLMQFISFFSISDKSWSHRALGLIIDCQRPPAAMRQFAAPLWLDIETPI